VLTDAHGHRCSHRKHVPCSYVCACGWLLLLLPWTRFRVRHHLNDQSVRDKYGFLYMGFSTRAYYWEIVIMIRKVCVISVVVFFKQFGTLVQVMLALGLVYLSYVAHIYARPYHRLSKNQAEELERVEHNKEIERQKRQRRAEDARAEKIAEAFRAGDLALAARLQAEGKEEAAAFAKEAEEAARGSNKASGGSDGDSGEESRGAGGAGGAGAVIKGRADSSGNVQDDELLVGNETPASGDSGGDGSDGATGQLSARALLENDSLGMEDLDHLEQVSLLATLGTFYFGWVGRVICIGCCRCVVVVV